VIAESAEICEFGGYQLDLMRRQLLSADGASIPLMPKAIETLIHLVTHAGQTLSKEELLRTVWPHTIVEENNLTQNISALRKALGEKSGEHRFIVTVPGQGYRFVAPVRKLMRSEGPAPARIEAPIARPSQGPNRRRLWIGVAAILIGAAGAVAGWLMSVRQDGAPSHPQTIAVLPFKPIVEGDRNEAMELGMADSLIMELSRSTHLIVRPLNATRRFASLDQDPIEAGRRLQVEAVVDGTIQIAAGRVRASARLLRVADGRQLWAGKFDERFSSIFQVQDVITQRVAEALQIRLNPRSHVQTDNLRAYELYMRGRLHAMRLVMPEVRRGIEYFEQAIVEDPSYALPYAGIADAMRALVLSNDAPPAEMAPRAKVAAGRAIDLAPDLAEANCARGLVALFFEWNWQAAERYLSRAVELAPNDAEARIYLAHLYSNLARSEEALAHARRASELNPISPIIGSLEGQFLGHQGEQEAAIRRLNEVISLDPMFWLSHHLLANALIDAGHYEASLRESAEAKRLSPLQTYSDAFAAVALARLGRKDEARAILETLSAIARESYAPPSHLAMIETALGSHDRAIAELETALSVRDARLVFLKIDPKWNDLRADPRFQSVMRRVGF
jgi:DNA-binding winged helix-turn-helix (wHTH) protein/TolB-like protein/Flp pilus assembly protein TadD